MICEWVADGKPSGSPVPTSSSRAFRSLLRHLPCFTVILVILFGALGPLR